MIKLNGNRRQLSKQHGGISVNHKSGFSTAYIQKNINFNLEAV